MQFNDITKLKGIALIRKCIIIQYRVYKMCVLIQILPFLIIQTQRTDLPSLKLAPLFQSNSRRRQDALMSP